MDCWICVQLGSMWKSPIEYWLVFSKIRSTTLFKIYYKYDSYPVDCVKVFTSKGRKIAFRFLQVKLYSSPVDLGRSDALRIYSSPSFLHSTLLAEFRYSCAFFVYRVIFRSDREVTPLTQSVSSEVLALHMRGTAADGEYGFLGEISSLPSPPDTRKSLRVFTTYILLQIRLMKSLSVTLDWITMTVEQ